MDDATEMREPPAAAVYYLSRIYCGHSCEMVLSGTARDFHAGCVRRSRQRIALKLGAIGA